MMIAALNDPRRQIAEIDMALLWSSLLILTLGIVMVYSASIYVTESNNQPPAYYLVHHGMYLCVGLALGAFAFQIRLATWQRLAPYLFLCGVLLLALTLVPGVGRHIKGAWRWIRLGPIGLQPSEFVKLFSLLYAADYTVRKIEIIHDLRRAFLPMAVAMSLIGGLLILEPDFGAFVVIVAIAMGILFLGGLRARLFAILTSVLLAAFTVLIVISPYRRARFLGFMDPWADPYGKGYQLSHSLIAFGRGEWFGVGLGASVEKKFYLPEAHTDFLLSIIGEELGFAGVLLVITLFAILVRRAFAIGRQCVQLELFYSALVAMGIGIWFGVQGFINMGVNVGLLPTKGLTLPFMSYGGSGLVSNCIALAILLRVDWENRQIMRGKKP
ncbi:MAG: putative lipid II flippase FtsW [Zoogloeaceae bacterium]|jgi:cell division protein FtsW|nr:putative lipid II flippase FtsW [Zoogloeaceae bacterium]